ncbi:MAG: thioredoxin [Propionibacteriaceae bacterium]|jgi:thioredoxin 1|nr:thioredoxin [Propionibacteriaceae bacterium]
MSNLTAVTDASFASEVLGASQPVLVDYWADWCSPCKQLAPVLDELAKQYPSIKFVSIDADANTAIPAAQDIRTLPTVQFFQGGQLIQALVGSVTKMKLRQILDDLS